MAEITITVPDLLVPDVLDAFAARFGRPNSIQNPDWDDDGIQTDPDTDGDPRYIANPETKAQFAKRMIANKVKRVYVDWKTDQAKVPYKAAIAIAESDIGGVS